MNRREFLTRGALFASGVALGAPSLPAEAGFPAVRAAEAKRRFKSRAVERTIETIKARIGNKELAWMFENCFPNALDTTVDLQLADGRPDTFVVTGDTDAMSLRDSTAQVWPYLPLMHNDSTLQQLIAGVINRQTRCIRKDPYANTFCKDDATASPWKNDLTEMRPGVYERKWALDSLCYPIRLAYHYWKAAKDRAPLDDAWRDSVLRTLRTFREQQRKTGPGPYRFQRRTEVQGDTLAGDGLGRRAKPMGLIYSMFRPGDDAALFPFIVPSNFLAVGSLRQAAELLTQVHHDSESAGQCQALADEVERALRDQAVVIHEKHGRILPYEIDGYGNYYCMDDGAVPSLLSLPYFDVVAPGSPLYLNTRRFILSDSNPYYCAGKAASGPGGPRVGRDMIWPLALLAQGLTSTDDQEVRQCLLALQKTHAGTGFMHEAFHKDDPAQFTRPWFPAANTMFGELILKSYRERPHVLN
ncbi:MAG TPA: glycoside hydrolase family 125 protein [Candidatus Paceibacterota bacterium]|nr:glycoside hydrolase family 125 protein [Verrucomicrobiota bacterium]HSA08760.1 glycoside hydrolase family 125 protein [Candidatus Paceibacterota bacterium]